MNGSVSSLGRAAVGLCSPSVGVAVCPALHIRATRCGAGPWAQELAAVILPRCLRLPPTRARTPDLSLGSESLQIERLGHDALSCEVFDSLRTVR